MAAAASPAWAGDVDTIMGTSDGSTYVSFQNAAGSTVAVVNSTGAVGIGTTIPATLLDVNGSAQFGSTAKSTFSTAGALTLAPGAALNLSGANGYITSASSVNASAFFGDGSHLSNLPAGGVSSVTANASQFSGNGTNAANALTLQPSSVTLQGNSFNGPSQLTHLNTSGNLALPYGMTAASATLSGGLTASSGTFLNTSGYSLVVSSGINMSGSAVFNAPTSTISAAAFVGSGAGLTGISASAASTNGSLIGNGTAGSPLGVNPSSVAVLNASGLVLNSQIDSSSVTKQGNAVNAPNGLVLLDGSGKLPVSVFSGGAALLASTQTFTGSPTFASSVTFSANGANIYSLSVSSGINMTGPAVFNAPTSTMVAAAFIGSLDASQLTGTLPSGVFSGKAALLASSQTFTGSPTFASSVTFSANGANIYSLSVSSGINMSGAAVFNAPTSTISAAEFIFPDGTKQTTAYLHGGNTLLLNSSQTVTGSTTFASSATFNNAVISGTETIKVLVETITTGSSGSNLTVNWSSGTIFMITLNNSTTLTYSGAMAGQTITLFLTQDGTGSRTVTWPLATKWAGGTPPTLTTTHNRTDIITVFYDGFSYWGFLGGSNY